MNFRHQLLIPWFLLFNLRISKFVNGQQQIQFLKSQQSSIEELNKSFKKFLNSQQRYYNNYGNNNIDGISAHYPLLLDHMSYIHNYPFSFPANPAFLKPQHTENNSPLIIPNAEALSIPTITSPHVQNPLIFDANAILPKYHLLQPGDIGNSTHFIMQRPFIAVTETPRFNELTTLSTQILFTELTKVDSGVKLLSQLNITSNIIVDDATSSKIIVSSKNKSIINHEVKSVNTRLNYVSNEQFATPLAPNNFSASIVEKQNRLPIHSLNNATNGIRLFPKKNIVNSTKPFEALKTLPTQNKNLLNKSLSQNEKLYQVHEQTDFDRLLRQFSENSSYNRTEHITDLNLLTQKNSILESERILPPNNKLLIQHKNQIESPSLPSANNNAGRNYRFSTRHSPQTKFERLFEDYRYRLSGQNGFNDIIKALHNSQIELYERRSKNNFKTVKN